MSAPWGDCDEGPEPAATRRFKVLLEWDPECQVWVTHVPALNDLSTFGDTKAEALENTKEAIVGYLESAAKEDISVPGEGPELEIVDVEVAV